MRTAAFPLVLLVATALLAPQADAQIAWRDNLRTAHAEAQSQGKHLLLHFYTDNCPSCDKLEEGAFQNQAVWQAIGQGFIPVKVHEKDNPKLTEMFGVTKFPTDVVVTTDGRQLSHTVSPQDPGRYVAMLAKTVMPPAASPAIAAAPAPAAGQAPSGSLGLPVSSPGPAAISGAPSGAMAGHGPAGGFAMPNAVAVSPATGRPAASTTQLTGNRSEGSSLSMPEPAPLAAAVATPVAKPAPSADVATTTPPNAATDDGGVEADVTPELALQGFCAVSVLDEKEWVEGRPEFGVVHLGRLYLFASKEKQQAFLADPMPYTPVMNEIDVVRFFEERRVVPGKREWGVFDPIHNRMFFFADEMAMNHFWNEYEKYTDAALAVMNRAIRDANPSVGVKSGS